MRKIFAVLAALICCLSVLLEILLTEYAEAMLWILSIFH